MRMKKALKDKVPMLAINRIFIDFYSYCRNMNVSLSICDGLRKIKYATLLL